MPCSFIVIYIINLFALQTVLVSRMLCLLCKTCHHLKVFLSLLRASTQESDWPQGGNDSGCRVPVHFPFLAERRITTTKAVRAVSSPSWNSRKSRYLLLLSQVICTRCGVYHKSRWVNNQEICHLTPWITSSTIALHKLQIPASHHWVAPAFLATLLTIT